MKYQIDPVSSDLVITVDAEEHETLATAQKEDPAFLSDAFMYDFIEPVWTNGLSCSIRPEDVGALTDAPMLCEYNAGDGSPQGKFWAFMDCAVRSPLQDFIDYGKARWTYGGTVTNEGNIVDDRGVATVPLRPDASAP